MKSTLKHTNFDRTAAGFPLTDCSYQLVALPQFHGGCARHELPSFRNISSDYFRREARGEFRNELIAFGAIVVSAAIPILSNLQALADFTRAIGSL